MVGVMAAMGSTISVTKTTTVSGPCTGMATLTDVRSTVVYTAPCTGTITYTSDSTTSSSTMDRNLRQAFSELDRPTTSSTSTSINNCGHAACHTGSGSDWPSFTLNNQDSRNQANSTITSANVAQMTQKWSIQTVGTTSTPVTLAG